MSIVIVEKSVKTEKIENIFAYIQWPKPNDYYYYVLMCQNEMSIIEQSGKI